MQVDDHGAPADRPLDAYMALSPEEWVELDARAITRVPADAEGELRFLLALPLRLGPELVLRASCTVDVLVDGGSRTLRFSGRNATLRVAEALPAHGAPGGDGAGPDAAEAGVADLSPRAAGSAAGADPSAAAASQREQQRRLAESLQAAALEVDFTATALWTPATRAQPAEGGAAEGAAQLLGWAPFGPRARRDLNGSLQLSARTSVKLALPGAVSRLTPSFVLESGGALLLKALTAAMLPEFGKLVASDYYSWSRGQERTGGALLASLQRGRAAPPGGPPGEPTRGGERGGLPSAADD